VGAVRTAGVWQDLRAGLVVFLVALPLCLGIALASNAPLLSGLIAGIIGGLVVAVLSGSQTSVSGPAAGLAAVVIHQMSVIGSYEGFLAAVMLAGAIQLVMGVMQAGFIALFFPASVIKGLLTAIGLLLILKQIPHLVGHDGDPEGDMAFIQFDHENTFSELWRCVAEDIHLGSTLIGLLSFAILFFGPKNRFIAKSPIPLALIVVMLGVALHHVFNTVGYELGFSSEHLVSVPLISSFADLSRLVTFPDFSQLLDNPQVWFAGITLAVVASLETLLNLEAVDKIDPKQRVSPPNQELIAQGCGNLLSGALGGLPITSVIVRSSVNINAGGQTKLSAIFHGLLLLMAIAFGASALNMIPLSCLAAILVVTGIKLLDLKQMQRILKSSYDQSVPYLVTVVAIITTDLLIGVSLGLACAMVVIFRANFKRSFRPHHETYFKTKVVRFELPLHTTFLGRASLLRAFQQLEPNSHLLIDASSTEDIDTDILNLIAELKEVKAPAHGVKVSLRGFAKFDALDDEYHFEDVSTQDLQRTLSPQDILEILNAGNKRFLAGTRIPRQFGQYVDRTSTGQFPLSVVLNCIDSRTAAELIFDAGIGELFSVRVAGNVISPKILGSLEYCVGVAGAKLIVVMGHTKCGAVSAAVATATGGSLPEGAEHCTHLGEIVSSINAARDGLDELSSIFNPHHGEALVDNMARLNMEQSLRGVYQLSTLIRNLVDEGRIILIGAMYDVSSGQVHFAPEAFSAAQAATYAADEMQPSEGPALVQL
jgi:carbonic anhydrase/SulP family sulfate permease